MKTNFPARSRAFTLIEILAVLAIMLILAAIVAIGAGSVFERQNQQKAKIQIATLSAALEQYKQDMGHYPLTADAADPGATNADLLYQALFHEGYTYQNMPSPPASWDKARRIYLPDLDPVTNKQGWLDQPADGVIPAVIAHLRDPWGNDYRYRSSDAAAGAGANANAVNVSFDLWSVGKDSRTNGSPSQTGHPDNRDDIRNFLPAQGMAYAFTGR